METPKENILKFMSNRPNCAGIIGYGSGVKPQVGQEKRKPQIDLIVIVKDLKAWHKENIKRNPKDYAFSSKLFFRFAPTKWLKAGGKICYMTYIPFEGHKYKIGTIEETDFLHDLKKWETFYMAGRMQKPILIVKATKEIELAIEYNRQAGVKVTQLMYDKNPEIKDFYITLASLSYIGDTRMGIAENPDKVQNIVLGNLDFYNEIYGQQLQIKNDYVQIKQNFSLETLPDDLKEYIDKNDQPIKDKITSFLTAKNKSQSMTQTLKGIFTTGPVRSIKYAAEKLKRRKRK